MPATFDLRRTGDFPTNRAPDGDGAVAQLGERLNGIQEVVGSIPIGSTIRSTFRPSPSLRTARYDTRASDTRSLERIRCGGWCRQSDLNTRPHPYQGCALPLSYGGQDRVYPARADREIRPIDRKLASSPTRVVDAIALPGVQVDQNDRRSRHDEEGTAGCSAPRSDSDRAARSPGGGTSREPAQAQGTAAATSGGSRTRIRRPSAPLEPGAPRLDASTGSAAKDRSSA